jgi:hypothetical protein
MPARLDRRVPKAGHEPPDRLNRTRELRSGRNGTGRPRSAARV